MVSRLRWLVLLLVVAVGVAACGSDDDETSTDDDDRATTTSTTTTTVPDDATTTTSADGGGGGMSGAISLTIEVTSDGQGLRSGTLSCGDTASGTGFLADPAAAEAACELVRSNPTAASRLVDGRDETQICTEIYGGPDVAKVTGDLDGRPVDTTIDRTDGCAIADWDTLEPLIGPPSGNI